ncbi:MAG TPA: 3-deoxy-D-manno-octulosonic acid transferase [Tepidisphaeraceae bacterium]|nr:3-deoxy-D-manno-octulosonic acid transferase [Tepidisphaeraceae bacterium]
MLNHYDIAYYLGLGASAPYWLIKPSARRKVLTALARRKGHLPRRDLASPAILIHAVSLGEINATRALVTVLQRERPDLNFVISTTTETGYERARELYGLNPSVTLIRFPLDFTAAVERTLDAIRVSLVVLMEGEIWPNFLKACERRDIRVLLVNARITSSAYRRYKLVRPVVARMLRRLHGIAAQDHRYAKMYVDLGAPPGRVVVSGTMKFDTAITLGGVPGASTLAHEIGLDPTTQRIWVCGSTGDGEEEIALRIYRQLLMKHPKLRLVIVPRHPQRFDAVAGIIESHRFEVVRRSQQRRADLNAPIPPIYLGDTMGELRKFYYMAEVVFVGRSLVDLGPRQHGSDMIEPAALSKPVIVGPYTGNFAEAMEKFKEANAISVVSDEEQLGATLDLLLSNPADAGAMGKRALAVVMNNQGATLRNAELILGQLQITNPPPVKINRPLTPNK